MFPGLRLFLLVAAVLCCLGPWQPQNVQAVPPFAVVDVAEGECPRPRGGDEWGCSVSFKARTLGGGGAAKSALPVRRGTGRVTARDLLPAPAVRCGRAHLSIWRI
ncbi:hypothetical protein [Nonomuraea soli]|uniref:Uncharacterized protein n=1 Tax=Nonomuraea soli TaxID=1032476 RepID=A0A7W0CS92_9ACTN|nr:hypothetical protein [Nonomuraea soli]MBA2896268.1 hypothetical protein [Nonomuraea soli]